MSRIYLLILIFILSGCNDRSGKRREQEKLAYAQTIPEQYHKISADTAAPSVASERIRQFYLQAPPEARKVIAEEVIEDLYKIAYRNPAADTAIPSFLLQRSTEKVLREATRQKAILKVVAYYLYGQKEVAPALSHLDHFHARYGKTMSDTIATLYYSLMGQAMLRSVRLQEAADYYRKSIALCESMRDSLSLASNYGNYGTVFSRMGNYRKAIEMKLRAHRYFLEKNDKDMMLIGYTSIGYEYSNMEHNDSALYYFFKAKQLLDEGRKNANTEFTVCINIAGMYMGKKQYDSARHFYNAAKALLEEQHKPNAGKLFLMASTPAYGMVRNVDKEIGEIKKFIPEFYEANDISGAKDAYYCLYYTAILQQKSDQALKYFLTYDSLMAVMADTKNQEYIENLEAKYETQKKELKIQVQDKTIAQSRTLNVLLFIAIALLAATVAFFISRTKLKEVLLQQKFTKQLLDNTEEERRRIARDLHDGIGQELLLLKHQLPDSDKESTKQIETIINGIRAISRNLHPVMLDKIGLKRSIEYICQQLMEHSDIFITTDIRYEQELDKNAELQLFRIVQESLTNIVKYAAAAAIKVSLRQAARRIIAEVCDNGKGFDVEATLQHNKAFGLLSIIERSKALRGKADISSSSSGTTVRIEIPLTEAP